MIILRHISNVFMVYLFELTQFNFRFHFGGMPCSSTLKVCILFFTLKLLFLHNKFIIYSLIALNLICTRSHIRLCVAYMYIYIYVTMHFCTKLDRMCTCTD